MLLPDVARLRIDLRKTGGARHERGLYARNHQSRGNRLGQRIDAGYPTRQQTICSPCIYDAVFLIAKKYSLSSTRAVNLLVRLSIG